jgi:acetyltransferase
LKIASAEIIHKSDAGGVLLQLTDPNAVMEGYRRVINNCQTSRPDAELIGVHVQKMIPPGQDVIVGAIQDPQFGAMVMFGSGGTEVEGLKDVQFALAPITYDEAELLLEETWAGRKLKGFRNLAPADRKAVLDVIIRVAQLAFDFPQLREIEINPLSVLEQGQGALAVDVRVNVHI